MEPGRRLPIDGLTAVATEVPHARESRFRTYAWRLRGGGSSIVYASDVGRLEPALRRFSERAGVLVIDGAMWRRPLFAHLTIDRELPALCGWGVRRIVLTQIGRSAPPHETFAREIRRLCERAEPAWDGLVIEA